MKFFICKVYTGHVKRNCVKIVPICNQGRLISACADAYALIALSEQDGYCRYHCRCISYTMGCPPVRGDNPQALASGLSYVQEDKHGITILYHLHQCRPSTS